MKKLFQLHIDAKPGREHMKWGSIKQIYLTDNTIDTVRFRTINLYQEINKITSFEVTLQEEPGKSRQYPDFISIDIKYYGGNKKVLDFLTTNFITFTPIQMKVVNDLNSLYTFLIFPEESLLNLEKSNGEMINDTLVTKGKTYFSPILSPLVLTKKAEAIEGIVRIAQLPNVLLCTEIVKKQIEQEQLSGVYFTRVEVDS